jgi:hypothetical protein
MFLNNASEIKGVLAAYNKQAPPITQARRRVAMPTHSSISTTRIGEKNKGKILCR